MLHSMMNSLFFHIVAMMMRHLSKCRISFFYVHLITFGVLDIASVPVLFHYPHQSEISGHQDVP